MSHAVIAIASEHLIHMLIIWTSQHLHDHNIRADNVVRNLTKWYYFIILQTLLHMILCFSESLTNQTVSDGQTVTLFGRTYGMAIIITLHGN